MTVLADTSATETDATNAKGYYIFDLAQAETNADKLLFSVKSATSNIVVVAVPAVVYTVPSAFGNVAGAAGGLLIAGSNTATTFAGVSTGAVTATNVSFSGTFGVAGATTFHAINTGVLTLSGLINTGTTDLQLTVKFASTDAEDIQISQVPLASSDVARLVAFLEFLDVTGHLTTSSFAAGAINAAAIATDAITAAKIADGAIDTATFATGTTIPRVTLADTATTVTNAVTTTANATETAIKAKTDNLPSDPADASDVAGAFSTVNATLATIASYVDTEVAAIKLKTDLIPASPAAVGDIPTTTQINTALTTAHGSGAWTSGGGGTTGSGTYPIDHDGGSGLSGDPATVDGVDSATDCMRFVSAALPAGVPSLTITAYLTSEYIASPPVRTGRGQTTSGSDGRWTAPLNLNSGTYTLVVDTAGDNYQSKTIALVIP